MSTDLLQRLATGLAERYHVRQEIGSGGMAVVFSAHDIRHDRDVAIKVLRPDISAAVGSERFLREIRICAKLFHPHILTLLDSGEVDALLYYVMPLLSGESLRDQITHRGALPLFDALRIAHECCDALSFAHAQGVVHRDIKPENILFEADHAIVADFGIARALNASGGGRLTTLGIAVGTPAYMSPEQAAGDPTVDVRSDIYSLAMVVFEMLYGRPAFVGTSAELMAKQVTEPPPALSSLKPDIPDRVSTAVARALSKNPEDRFATVKEFAAALGARHADYGGKRKRSWMPVAIVVAALIVAWAVNKSVGPAREEYAAQSRSGIASGFNRRLEQVTFAEGVEQWPAWSPDAKSLAYTAEVQGHRKIFIRSLASGEEKQITQGTADEIQPSWSGDGTRIAFVRARIASSRLEPVDVNGTYQEGGDIWLVEINSGKETLIIENAFDPVFSPDGKQLAFDASWAGAQRLWISDAEGRNPRQVTSDSSEAVAHAEPSWSHDSKRLAFRRAEKTISDIGILDVASQKVTLVTQDNILDMNPVWAPDDRSIYFSSAGGGGGINIWQIGVTESGERTGGPQQLTTGAGDDINPSIAPDGQVAFSLRAFDSDIWQLRVDPLSGKAADAPSSVVRTTRVESRGSWSPDGKSIAFNSDRRGEMNIWVKTLASGTERQLTTGPGGDYQANWTPGGKTVVFFSARSGNSDIWSADITSGNLARLTNDPAMDTNPFYSPDEKQIAFMSDRRGRLEVWVMNSDGSSQRAVSDLRAGGHFIRWLDDGKAVVFRAESGTQFQTMKVRVADGRSERLRDIASGAHMSWSPKYDHILDVKGHKTLTVYPLSGESRKVFDFPDAQVRIDYPVWSPDGRGILFDRAAPRGGDIWLLKGKPRESN